MSAFALKLIALISMLVDHIGGTFPQYFGTEFRVIGRIAFPIFVFLVAEGFRHTKSPVKFLTRLFVFAIISEPFYDMALRGATSFSEVNFLANTNIFYTLFLGGLAITIHKWANQQQIVVKILATVVPLLACMWIANRLTTDYGAIGVLLIFMLFWVKHKGVRLAVLAVLSLRQFEWIFRRVMDFGVDGILDIMWWMLIPATLVGVLLVAFYNGKRGRGLKWFFYVAYPAHLAILAAISILFVQ